MNLEKEIEIIEHESEYIKFLKYYCMCDFDAYTFILSYATYVHAIDDIIDGDKTDHMHILKTFELAAILYANQFYLNHLYQLRPLVLMASNTYMTSVTLEKKNPKELWMTHVSDALRQTGNELMLAVIGILHGIDIRVEASLKLRKISWLTHHTKEGVPI